jgi:hypothetical protein
MHMVFLSRLDTTGSSLKALKPDQVYFNRLPESLQPKPKNRSST